MGAAPVNVTLRDQELAHLYPPFRERLRRTLVTVAQATGRQWTLVEGFRSVERQIWLYGQGRTRSGPVTTWLRYPRWHGAGLAADVAPLQEDGAIDWGAPLPEWQALRRAGKGQGLANPAWLKGDRGHLEFASHTLRPLALAWCRVGFPERAPLLVREVAIAVDGVVIPDAHPDVKEAGPDRERVWVWARAVLEAAEYVILGAAEAELVVAPGTADRGPTSLPCLRMGGRAMVSLRNLTKWLAWEVAGDVERGIIHLSTKAKGGTHKGGTHKGGTR